MSNYYDDPEVIGWAGVVVLAVAFAALYVGELVQLVRASKRHCQNK